MTDIGITISLDGAYLSVPSVPGNGQEGTAANDIAFTGTGSSFISKIDDISATFLSEAASYRINSEVNLPAPITTYYSLAANLTAGNAREYWTDVTPSLVNSPSGAGAYVSGSLTILGSYSVVGSIAIPAIISVTPVIGDPAITINMFITGTNFVDGATVKFNGVLATNVVVQASNLITCTTPIIGTLGSVNIIVTNPNGRTSGSSGTGIFTTIPAPTVTAITPNTGSSGTSITDLHGTGFYPGATVIIGGVSATNVVWVSSTQLTCTLGSSPVGVSNVVVTNVTGQTSGTSGNGLFTVTFNPSSLNLTLWQKAPFVSLPQNGSTSVGTSATRRIVTHGATDPTVGAALNGLNGAYYRRSPSTALVQLTSGGSTLMEDLVANANYTVSFLVNILSAGKHDATPYQASQFMSADAHWGWGFSCDASLVDTNDLTFNGTAHTITRTSGNWSTDGWVNGQPIFISNTTSNNGNAGGATVTNVAPTVLTLSGGLVNETITGTAIDVGITSGGRVNVFHYNGAFPFVSANCSVGLHWIYIRHTATTTQIDIDGISGSAQSHPDHIGSSGFSPQINWSSYINKYLSWTEYERYTMQSSQTDVERDNYKSYLNTTYGTSF